MLLDPQQHLAFMYGPMGLQRETRGRGRKMKRFKPKNPLSSKQSIHTARTDRKYQSPLCANMAYIFEIYIPVETFWCKIWIHTCTILGIGLIFTTVAPIFD